MDTFFVAGITILVAILIVAGAGFSLLAALGLLRFPDLYTRMHAASKAGTVGSGLLLVAAGLHSLDPAIFVRALAGFVFLVLTAPISAHLLAKAAHQAGYRMTKQSVIDQLPQKEEPRRH
ncbi:MULTISPECIES: monovalent cation/H(+) antiporter subunit G [Sinorhizobium]|uniref:Na+/H+ antiporter subunit G n=1 Tax=Sinorhizobium americanum TaxID=194963 RepID=A0A2S3YHD5_9HYPH|nr:MULTISPECIES: monovalent cation/H(+) antiporter subunit G [Sinorhizobium]ASY55685.1 Na(+) H(+) antiporter subunit G [Sinorhizobium sp. CCBAU 05631]PDT40564.1 Na+/H+ antiporter subunit G [Sinorhizobium sp. FG01]PDT52343.1 Na+/H+ antiporter subunit G [Sinorhizobium sp. NG07B]POH26163.1 Na+/H+ antiporter subunit G [Sinorhizobium americanum]POH28075.1 Na+/H+ antiporter subunit G [Sinorhizobium americanum]